MYVTHGSNVGLVRSNNEDSYICLEPYAFAVADGMGGHAAGEVASRLLIEEVKKRLQDKKEDELGEDLLKKIIIEANDIILHKASEDEHLAGMGTTASIVCLRGKIISWAHIGDSRIYFMHKEKLQQITTDHSLVDLWLRNGTITAEEALHHPQKNILTRAVGVDSKLDVDTGSFTAAAGDILLLSTDGLTNMIDDMEIKEILSDEAIKDKAGCLINKAVANGGADNVTAIVVKF